MMNGISLFLISSGQPIVASLTYSLHESTWPGKLIVVLLFASSIYVWSIMVLKYIALRRAAESSDLFDRRYRQEANPIGLFLRKERYPESPLFEVYEKACVSMGAEIDAREPDASELFAGSLSDERLQLKPLQLEAVRNTSERTVSTVFLNLERTMPVLATAVTASPFLGLLGTVWGVMDSFSGMAQAGSATLSAVAPGIAGALLTTVVGLLVALPSAIGYNLLTSRVRELQVRADNFSLELVADIQRNFLSD